MASLCVVQSLGTYIHLQLASAVCIMGENRETVLAVSISDSMDTETTAEKDESQIWDVDFHTITEKTHTLWYRYVVPNSNRTWLICSKDPSLWCYECEMKMWQTDASDRLFFSLRGEWQRVVNASASD